MPTTTCTYAAEHLIALGLLAALAIGYVVIVRLVFGGKSRPSDSEPKHPIDDLDGMLSGKDKHWP